jgi:hypothetical protein
VASIRYILHDPPGLKYDVVFAHDAETQQFNGVLPSEISFQADAFTASVGVQGPGEFGFEVYRNNLPLAKAAPATFTNATRNYFIESKAGGQAIRMHVTSMPDHD